jgi:hypothetical protein
MQNVTIYLLVIGLISLCIFNSSFKVFNNSLKEYKYSNKMVIINTVHINPVDTSYIGDILMSSKFHTHIPINIYSYYSSKENENNLQRNVFNIQLSQERQVNSTEKFHLTLGHVETSPSDKTIWFPYLLNKNPQQYLLKNRLNNTAEKFCSFVVLNHRCEMRNKAFDYISENYKQVDALGKHKRNVSEEVAKEIEKYNIHDHRYLEVLSKYKFMICFENENEPFYVTEKLANAWLAGCIPIYWGMKDIEYIINKKCFIHVKSENDFPKVLERIKELDSNPELYEKMRREPFFQYDKVPYFFTKDYYVEKINEVFDRTFGNFVEPKKKVISYSLYGTKPIYLKGAIRNAEMASLIYPGWELWFYTDKAVDKNITDKLKTFKYVKIIEIDISKLPNDNWAKCIRFLPMDDPTVDVMLSRDTDSRFSIREVNAVNGWLKTDKTFHIVRDHPWHGSTIIGGSFGSRKIKGFKFAPVMQQYIYMQGWEIDQVFLRERVYPLIKDDSVINAAFHKYEPHAVDMPDKYIDRHFMTEYISEDEIRGEQYNEIPANLSL